jgi:hypothetical protein
MDLPSLKMGYRLKRLQETSKVIRLRTHQLLMALKKTQEEVGYTDAIKVYVSLKHFQTARSIKEVTQDLDKAEEELLDLAQNIIGLMTISKSDD